MVEDKPILSAVNRIPLLAMTDRDRPTLQRDVSAIAQLLVKVCNSMTQEGRLYIGMFVTLYGVRLLS